jgi:hypothetical protein
VTAFVVKKLKKYIKAATQGNEQKPEGWRISRSCLAERANKLLDHKDCPWKGSEKQALGHDYTNSCIRKLDTKLKQLGVETYTLVEGGGGGARTTLPAYYYVPAVQANPHLIGYKEATPDVVADARCVSAMYLVVGDQLVGKTTLTGDLLLQMISSLSAAGTAVRVNVIAGKPTSAESFGAIIPDGAVEFVDSKREFYFAYMAAIVELTPQIMCLRRML